VIEGEGRSITRKRVPDMKTPATVSKKPVPIALIIYNKGAVENVRYFLGPLKITLFLIS